MHVKMITWPNLLLSLMGYGIALEGLCRSADEPPPPRGNEPTMSL